MWIGVVPVEEDVLRLCIAMATFQRLMAQALFRVTKKYGNLVLYYVDDVAIAKPTLKDHIDRLDEVFGCMKRAGLKCNPSKCEILRDSNKYLGRMVDRHGVRPDPEAAEAVLTLKAPGTDEKLMSFLGFANYYREFIKGQGVSDAEADAQQRKEVRMER